ncbi:class I SAM-dependent methyltransferase [Bacillus niameyensis]|uniref:class I SAM-dependent methyltransferase n=1 Tax=Bacillus niameyensis TaxID=1522308 RepID=UPI000782728B|nr:class I SAM-dependent methyltransferase [Bacillus niameyensis]
MLTNSKEFLTKQYNDSSKLDIRIALHELYSTNEADWHEWVFDHIKFEKQSTIIEFGCGSGALWAKNKSRINSKWEIILTDLSEGMLEKAKKSIGELPNITYQVKDVQSIDLADSYCDITIANHMLYHVPNITAALSEIKRILKSSGTFYTATNSSSHMKEIYEFIAEFDASLPFSKPLNSKHFGLENGEQQLRNFFQQVRLLRFEGNLKVTNVHDLADYIFTIGTELKAAMIRKGSYNNFIDFLEAKKNNQGYIHITKDTGIFICSN